MSDLIASLTKNPMYLIVGAAAGYFLLPQVMEIKEMHGAILGAVAAGLYSASKKGGLAKGSGSSG